MRSGRGEFGRAEAPVARRRRVFAVVAGIVVAVCVLGLLPRWWSGRDADAWLRGDPVRVHGLAEELVSFEADDDRRRATGAAGVVDGMWGSSRSPRPPGCR
ncbi:hypothetical protein [Nocardia sp. alder85J]|uniref:hypothetical protein n=1 Tax=Nocardia sp. alder85J TaxID=2862949 RepID=UPI0022566212|nr:hypothetical protein [Nocardia sp. alder85J]MCX4091356.1 hypothetical protein [Nocardia sp. alder85J]